ncbi:Putative Fe-S cluster [Desulfacinum hydrothermale DSM 13146]|uniref:Putative Fe-S cluster n=1 Tax=Desulfacinum hydrothermale DSM 13146 TaxID=1121390 RepID=A0A1W1XED2_9BACT|nr:(Fe-S)-binding protein [Desulfacinum hydrothermale]SMC22405.1 Putative Fe-S cluster [Desulfacinum hydrothermale DSM 13146]
MKLNVVEILKHLPKTNCKECGEPTCMAFAARLAKKDIELKACPPLFTSEYAAQREALENLLMGAVA